MPDADPAMGRLTGLVAGLGMTGLLLAATLLLVAPRLRAAMVELGGAHHRGRFWATLGAAALAVGTLLAALVGYWWHATAPTGAPLTSAGRVPEAVWAALDVLRWTLAALTFGLASLAAMVLTATATSPNVAARHPQDPPRTDAGG